MEKLRVRCPQCTKLYQVDSNDIESDTPHFKCVVCSTAFYFQYTQPSSPLQEIAIREMASYRWGENDCVKESEISSGSPVSNSGELKGHRSCPKCGALNRENSVECHSCRVIFARLEGLPVDRNLGAQPSLVRKWKVLLEDFENEAFHEEFIQSCSELGALQYALKQYQQLLELTGNDSHCVKKIAFIQAQMLQEVHQQQSRGSQGMTPLTDLEKILNIFDSTSRFFVKNGIVLCYLGSVSLILVGYWSIGQRNLVGVGTALILLIAGIHSIFKGKISF